MTDSMINVRNKDSSVIPIIIFTFFYRKGKVEVNKFVRSMPN